MDPVPTSSSDPTRPKNGGLPRGWFGNARQIFNRVDLPPVAADDAQHFPRTHVEGHVLERPPWLVVGPATGSDPGADATDCATDAACARAASRSDMARADFVALAKTSHAQRESDDICKRAFHAAEVRNASNQGTATMTIETAAIERDGCPEQPQEIPRQWWPWG